MDAHGAWTVAGSGRVDWFQNYDGNQRAVERNRLDALFDSAAAIRADRLRSAPRRVAQAWDHWAVSASGFRAFRAPTPSELYRSTQVGNQLTKPNGLLQERARHRMGDRRGLAMALGQRSGPATSSPRSTGPSRPSPSTRTRRPSCCCAKTSARSRAKGVSLDFGLAPRRWLAVDGGYQYAHATVTRGASDLGNWIPESRATWPRSTCARFSRGWAP